MDQDHREYLEDRGSHQLEVEAYERERRAAEYGPNATRGAGAFTWRSGVIVAYQDEYELAFNSHEEAVRAAHAILSEVEIAQRGEDVLHPASGDCEVCHGTRTIAVAGPDENGQYDTDDCPACSVAHPNYPGDDEPRLTGHPPNPETA